MRPQTAAATIAFLVVCLILAVFAAHVAEAVYLVRTFEHRATIEGGVYP